MSGPGVRRQEDEDGGRPARAAAPIHLRCPACELELTARYLAPRHCPRCLAVWHRATPLVTSGDGAKAAAIADAEGPRRLAPRAGDDRGSGRRA